MYYTINLIIMSRVAAKASLVMSLKRKKNFKPPQKLGDVIVDKKNLGTTHDCQQNPSHH